MAPSSELAPRWKALEERGWTCHSCGETHRGVIDLGYDRPLYWSGHDAPWPNSELNCAGSILTEDFCVLDGEHFFIRTLLLLPLVGNPGSFLGLGLWSSLSKPNFDLYVETFDDGNQSRHGPWFSWLSNGLKGYPDCRQLKSMVFPQDDGQRPLVQLDECSHPLSFQQREGIPYERLLELYAANGHDVDPGLFQ
jgi:hypothetical protein